MELYKSVDLSDYISDKTKTEKCKDIYDSLVNSGLVCVKNPLIDSSRNDKFTDMMESYFAKRGEMYYKGVKINEIRPELSYQVGATPEKTEKPRNHCSLIEELGVNAANKPLSLCPPEKDLKWRYFYRIGEQSQSASYFDQAQIIPSDIPDFSSIMEEWGNDMLSTIRIVLEMLNVAMGLPEGLLLEMNKAAPNLLAPTGSDLTKYNAGSVFAGFHYDLNLLTIHGKSRYPGLFAWTREGEKFTVKVQDGYLLIQAGMELEWLTGGFIKAGFHEVVYTEQTAEALKKRREQEPERAEFWRISSTLFSHVNTNYELEVLQPFKNEENVLKYPKIKVTDYIYEQLKGIELAVDEYPTEEKNNND